MPMLMLALRSCRPSSFWLPQASISPRYALKQLNNSRRCVSSKTESSFETATTRPGSTKSIGTHSGLFQCDEALAVYLLRQTSAYCDASIKRTRDPDILASCDVVVDVGHVYDESKQLFDHHQEDFDEVFGYGRQTKLSSAGLVYKHFGREIISNKIQIPISDPKVEFIWVKIYKDFIEAIDAIDNRVSQYEKDILPKYKNATDLSSRIKRLNPWWNQSTDAKIINAKFEEASKIAGSEFLERLNYYANSWLPARDILISSIAISKATIDPSGKIIVLERMIPWKAHLFAMEADENFTNIEAGQATYVLFKDSGGSWRIQAVPLNSQTFESRKALPQSWRGLHGARLLEASGINGGMFVHGSGFIGGTETKESALKMAQAALSM